ncbi:MAG: hypothetical protein KatS3mg105_0522 [Gemmatales bacterium]|nr:MAG: hypothetical protein KatS3mg105_0522 [Gemmatales bacterium]
MFASGPPGTWRIAYLLLALSSAIAAIYLYRFVPAREDQQSRAKAWTEGDSHTSATASTCLPLLLLLAAMILGGFNYRLMVTIMPTYLSGESATSAELLQGGVFVLVAMSFGAAGQIASGFCSDRFGARRMYLGVIVMLIPCAVALSATGGTWLALVMACLLTFFMFAQQPLENSLLAEYTSRRRRGASYATKFALTFGVGALGAYVAGLFWEQYRSVAPVFHVIAFSAGLMVLLLFVFVVKTRTVATPSAASQRAVESPLVTWPIDRFAGERT